jgi:hypothetical protein
LRSGYQPVQGRATAGTGRRPVLISKPEEIKGFSGHYTPLYQTVGSPVAMTITELTTARRRDGSLLLAVACSWTVVGHLSFSCLSPVYSRSANQPLRADSRPARSSITWGRHGKMIH